MAAKMIKKELFDGSQVEIVGENFEAGKPDKPGLWRGKFTSRQEMLRYLETGERYWSKKEGFGSEKRKSPA